MKTRMIALASAAAAMVAAPAMANATAARSAAPAEGEQALGGANVIIALLAVAAVVVGIVLIADDEPTSP